MDSQGRGFSQFLQKAASQFSEYSGADAETETATSTTSEAHHKKKPSSASSSSEGHGKKPPSASEALSSAKYLLDTAVSKLHKAESESAGGNQLDKAKIAAAATGLLEAAKHYGKLDESNQGKYIQKAEDYLNKYGGQEHHTSTGNSAVHSSKPHSASGSTSEDEENKYGKYLNTAEGYLHKYGGQERPTGTGNSAVHNSKPHSASQSASEEEENNYGKYFKAAEDLFKKF